ncbi:MAG: HesA/MoeB/ThiF family protein [Deltaproteobacteria bacterium]|nr:HesA/MoeB/ThiF family protein [Deltaproteobacteria bacterium]
MLTTEELKRYSRQIAIFGEEGQEKLKRGRVLLAGAGGLGTPAAVYLTLAGVGFIRIVDDDVVEETNFNRQILHWQRDLGRPKTQSVMEKLRQMNPYADIEAFHRRIDEASVHDLAADVDVIVDAMDNFETRYLLNRAAIARRIPLMHGAIREFYGQATTVLPGQTACLKCIFAEGPKAGSFPVLGAVAGFIATVQATEVIKYLTGKGDLLAGRLLLWDGLRSETDSIKVGRNRRCIDCGGI